jgi:hypothetical protein
MGLMPVEVSFRSSSFSIDSKRAWTQTLREDSVFDQEQLLRASKWNLAADLAADEGFARSIRSLTRAAALRAGRTTLVGTRLESEEQAFVRSHTYAWAEFVTNLGHWQRTEMDLQLPRSDRVLIAGWHFPEIPKIASFLGRVGALLLVSQDDAPWLQPFKRNNQLLNLLSENSSTVLARRMKAGAIVAAVLDNHHDTRHEVSTLLGRRVNTPSGILELCPRFDYVLAFIAPRGEGVKVVQHIDTRGLSAAYLAQQYNRWLEAEIASAPERWLMWQVLPVDPAPAEGRDTP